ncbi:hypothetical protein Ami103574_05350 [Aminipila butyrica]|uniref:Copper amine oxidase-like N-terminal domain-containing protein n=1 Tax=Aminipila butyrica TaxID=433296 RepID=A0A858BS45_9FIRM|nr:stalk domain-containing protein [Aminipila butyrica]QIB68781.1 hypothetical protein Ami103574_05350 [Aminipila butyrica]
MRNKNEVRKKWMRKTCCWAVAAAVMLTGGTGGAYGATRGQQAIGEIGVDITWYDFGKQWNDYYIRQENEGDIYKLIMADSEGQESKAAFVNGKGELIWGPAADDGAASSSSGGENITLMKSGNRYIYIDSKGIRAFPDEAYSDIGPFGDGYATATLRDSGHKGIIDDKGTLLFEDKSGIYQELNFMGGGLISAVRSDGLCDVLDKEGKPLNAEHYGSYRPVLAEDAIRVSRDGKYGFLDLSGTAFTSLTYDYAMLFSEGLAAVSKGEKWGFIDRTGKEVIALSYEDANDFHNGVAAVELQGKWGIIDKAGSTVLPFEYNWFYEEEDGSFIGQKDQQIFLIDSAGQVTDVKDYLSFYKEAPDRISVRKNINGLEVKGYLDDQERMLTGFKDFDLWPAGADFYLGHRSGNYPPEATPPNDYGQKYALLDAAGNNLTGFKYENSGDSGSGFQVLRKNYYTGAGLLNRQGAEVLPTIFEDILLTDGGYAFVTVVDPEIGGNGRVGYFKLPEHFQEKAGQRPITVYLDGVELYFDTPPVLKNQRTMVPMRKIFETLGAKVEWDNTTKTASATLGNRKIRVSMDSTTASVDGSTVQLDAAPFVQNGTTMVPLRFISESLDAQVAWDGPAHRVVVNSAQSGNLSSLAGSWVAAESSLEKGIYTGYLELTIGDSLLKTVDWQAGNPGMQAKIRDTDEKYIYMDLLENEGSPADWTLQKQDKIEYQLYSDRELRLKHGGTTCIFYKKSELTEEQTKVLDKLANIRWEAEDNRDLTVSFSYYQMKLYRGAENSESKGLFVGRTYLNVADAQIVAVPEITEMKGENTIWPGIEKEKAPAVHYKLSADEKTLTLEYGGKEIQFKSKNEVIK